MKRFKLLKASSLLALGLSLGCYSADARTDDAAAKKARDQIQRTGQLFDVQANTVSNVQFVTTNYGIFGYDPRGGGNGAGYWPRGSDNQYIFSGGVWLGALKKVATQTAEGKDTTVINKLCAISYNPNSGTGWMVPGRVDDGDDIQEDQESIEKYRTYFSTDFDESSGEPFDSEDGPNWPIWDTDAAEVLKENRYTGNYVDDINLRNDGEYPKGPAFISQEDVVCFYKDTDLEYYEGGEQLARQAGYPLRLDVEQKIFSWGFGKYQQFLFLLYNIRNRSSDTLTECWMAPAYDFDIATRRRSQAGAANDRTRFYEEDPSLNLAFQWTEDGAEESGAGFGYIGIDFLESPAVDAEGYLRQDKKTFPVEEQLGLRTFKNWVIENDPSTNSARYDFVSANVRDADDQNAGDKRFLVATGPFNMRPGENARVVVGMVFASPSTAEGRLTVPTGTKEDVQNLVNISIFAQSVYDDNYKAPVPPVPAKVQWEPLNNAVEVTWDDASERSFDEIERGLDFVGYRIYRAKNPNLDSFDIDVRRRSLENNDKGRGPLGWKQIAQYELPAPFLLSTTTSPAPGTIDNNSLSYTPIDSMVIQSFDKNSSTFVVDRLLSTAWLDYWNTKSDSELRDIMRGTIKVDTGCIRDKFNDTVQADIANLMRYIQYGCVEEYNIVDLHNSDTAGVGLFIRNYMDSITGGRKFVDFGDDNRDGQILATTELSTTEVLVNNLDYHYRVLAYDEGDYFLGTPGKRNTGQEGRNQVTAVPVASAIGSSSDITLNITAEDSARMGGLYNFNWVVTDQDRLTKLLGGHTLEVEFEPVWSQINTSYLVAGTQDERKEISGGVYGRTIVVRDLTDGVELARYPFYRFGNWYYSENGAIYVLADTSGLGLPDNMDIDGRGGSFDSKDQLWAPNQTIYNALAFEFDHYIQQWGGELGYHPDGIEVIPADPSNPPNTVVDGESAGVATVAANFYTGFWEGFNNGPGTYEIEFTEGGIEQNMQVELALGNNETRTVTVNVPYLNVKVREITKFVRPDQSGTDVEVSYERDFEHNPQAVPNRWNPEDANDLQWPDARFNPIGTYNLSGYAWVNSDGDNGFLNISKQAGNQNTGRPVGQGRYYLTALSADKADTVRFAHVIQINGGNWAFDFSNKGNRKSGLNWEKTNDWSQRPTVDFKPGDKVVVSTKGGALGFPTPGFKFTTTISETENSLETITDEMLDEVTVVPNPYYISHIGQENRDRQSIYFNKLPAECTISIYTAYGDLVKVIEHNADLSPEADVSEGLPIDVWNLLTEFNQRVASQTLLAVIETPNGAQTTVKFSIVQGGFRRN